MTRSNGTVETADTASDTVRITLTRNADLKYFTPHLRRNACTAGRPAGVQGQSGLFGLVDTSMMMSDDRTGNRTLSLYESGVDALPA